MAKNLLAEHAADRRAFGAIEIEPPIQLKTADYLAVRAKY